MKFFLTLASNFSKNLLISAFVFLQMFFLSSDAFSQVYINEFQASNKSMVPEMYDFGDFPDWIELYNSSNSTVSLGGYSLTDDINEPDKYVFPGSVSLPPYGYFRIWADGYDVAPGETYPRPWEWTGPFTTIFYHVPFKISKSGEEIALFNPSGIMVDYIEFGPQVSDASYGRKPDGSDNWMFFGDPTPNASNTTTGYSNTSVSASPAIFPEGGFYENNTSVTTFSSNTSAVLRYTLDGSLPDENSPVYSTPIIVNSSKTVRVRAYEPDKLPAFAEIQPFIYDDKDFEIPIITITTDPLFLWGYPYGIYSNELKQRNIPIKMEYFKSLNEKVLSTYATLKLSGQLSYTYPQKPFTITAKSKFGADYLNYPFFGNVDNSQYKSIYLRNSGWPDIYDTFFRDALSHTIVYDQMNIDAQSYQPAATYLNGEFWGIYNIREKLNTNYFEYHHNADPDNIDLLEYDDYSTGPNVIIVCEGSSDNFDALKIYMASHDLSIQENYDYIKTQIDIDEYINYMIAEIFVDNNNWQHCNVKWWRERKEGAKWRWILLDTDYAFGIAGAPSHNLLSNTLSSGWENFVFRKLNENQSFKDEFIQRFAAYMNSTFKEERTTAIVDSLKNNIVNAIPYHFEKWGVINGWENNVNAMYNFALNRPDYQRQHIKNQYAISSIIDIDITVTGGEGKIFANDVWLPDGCLSGKYFAGVPIRLKAVPVAGYQFVEWEGISTENTIILTPEGDMELHAIFAPSGECVLLSEITEDFVLDASCEYYIALGDIVIDSSVTLEIEAGVEIRMPKSANIYVHGSLIVSGTEDEPVVIKPNLNIEALSWGGICFDNANGLSEINNLKLLKATKGDNESFKGAISSYHSDVILNKVSVENVRKPFYSEFGNIVINDCDFRSPYTCDLINVKYADSVIIENCNLRGNDAVDTDAIDLDGVSIGIVRGNTIHGFYGFNSDGIDLGEACLNVLIENNMIFNISDKGISVGQASICTVKRNVVIGCAQGVGIKDFSSYAHIDQNTFYGNDYAVACFEKNVGFGGGEADIVNTIISSSGISSYFVDELSELSITYSLSDTETLPGTGNLATSPLFVDEPVLNLELQENSPCIDAGDPASPLDPDNSIADMGAYYTYGGASGEYTVVFNEINYNSSDNENNSGDWVELYNYGENEVDMSYWLFTDDNLTHRFQITKGTIIQPGEYMIIGNDEQLFAAVYGTEHNYIGDFDFGLGNGGDAVRLFDSDFKIVDIVIYDDVSPWPECPDGTGASLMLIDPLSDNALPENWAQNCGYPTPGIDNHSCTADFDFTIVHGCTGVVNFINMTQGICDSVSWHFEGGTVSEIYSPTYIYENTGTYTVQLEIFTNGGIQTMSKDVEIQYILEVPEVTDGYNCGSGTVDLHAVSSEYSFWYDNETIGIPVFVSDDFTTPVLGATTIYYVANALNTYCSSYRVPVEAVIYDEVVADFDYTITQHEVVFENKSLNATDFLWDFGDGTNLNDASNFVTHTYSGDGTYNVSLFSANEQGACDSTIQKEIVIDVISVDNYTDDHYVSIFPNPFSDKINISFSQNNSQVVIEIYDVNGKKILSKSLSNIKKGVIEKIDLSDVVSGIYILKIWTDSYLAVRQIVK